MTTLTADNLVYLIGVLSLISMVLQVYSSIIKPQFKSDKTDALLSQQLSELAKNTAAQFLQMAKDFANLRDNHVHTLQGSIETTNKNVADLTTRVAVLSQIIDERIPKKQ